MLQHAVIYAWFGLYQNERYTSVNSVGFTYWGTMLLPDW